MLYLTQSGRVGTKLFMANIRVVIAIKSHVRVAWSEILKKSACANKCFDDEYFHSSIQPCHIAKTQYCIEMLFVPIYYITI